MKKEKYVAPYVELIQLSDTLSFLQTSFSNNAGVDDWNGDGNVLDSELEGELGSDLKDGGLLGNN